MQVKSFEAVNSLVESELNCRQLTKFKVFDLIIYEFITRI